MEKSDGALTRLHQDKVHPAGASGVEHTGAAGCGANARFRPGRLEALIDHRLSHQLHGEHRLAAGLGLFDGSDRGVAALLAVGQTDGGRDLGAGEVLEDLEVFLGFGGVAGALQGAGELEFRRGVDGVDLEGLVKGFDGLVELLHFAVAEANEVP